MKAEIEQYYPPTKQHLREWFQQNHLAKDAVWFIFYKKQSGKPSVSWSDAVDEALCFGWIDSRIETIDEESFRQYFCKRKPKSTWSKINKEKIERLSALGLMAPAGFAVIEIAKQNGSWTSIDEVEALIVPSDLEKALEKNPASKAYFSTLSDSKKKILLSYLALTKTEATKQKRIIEIVENATEKQLPKAFRPNTTNK